MKKLLTTIAITASAITAHAEDCVLVTRVYNGIVYQQYVPVERPVYVAPAPVYVAPSPVYVEDGVDTALRRTEQIMDIAVGAAIIRDQFVEPRHHQPEFQHHGGRHN